MASYGEPTGECAPESDAIHPARKPLPQSLTQKFVHTSDVHLETDTFGADDARREAARQGSQGVLDVIDVANDRDADLLLIVGDLFDSGRVTEEGLAFAFGTIARAKMPVVMIPGNHDAHDERSIYAKLSPSVFPRNLHLILDPEGESLDFPDLEARYGDARWSSIRPSIGRWVAFPIRIRASGTSRSRTDSIPRTARSCGRRRLRPTEIERSGYHYIALGHVHIYNDVSQGSTRALYCGTPAPLYASDSAGWVAVVDCVPGQPHLIESLW